MDEDVEDYIYNLDRGRTKYIQFVYLGDYKLAVQLNQDIPVTILDLHEPKNPPVILQDVCGVKNLISMGNGCLAWYEKSTSLVILYNTEKKGFELSRAINQRIIQSERSCDNCGFNAPD